MLLFDFTVTSFIFVTIAVKVDESTRVALFSFSYVFSQSANYASYVEERKECTVNKRANMAKRFATTNAEDPKIYQFWNPKQKINTLQINCCFVFLLL